jgi:hypothetical protein
VRRGQQRADVAHPAGAQQVDRREHARIFGHDVPGPPAQVAIRQRGERGVEVGDIAQCRYAEQCGRPLAARPACGVLPVHELMRRAGVDDEHGETRTGEVEGNVQGGE